MSGRFRVVERLGDGSSGTVDRVVDQSDGAERALKWVALADSEGHLLLRLEYRRLLDLHHPQIPLTHGMGVDYELGIAWLLLEIAEGDTLDIVATRHGSRVVPELLLGALRVLAFLHARGVIHGDLKPGNLMAAVHDDGRAADLSILDFGLASERSEPRPRGSGTPRYMSPAVLNGGEVTEAADLYALGRIFEDAFAIGPPSDSVPIRSAHHVVERLVALGPGAGYQSAGDALAALAAALSTGVPGTTHAPLEAPFLGRDEVDAFLRARLADLRSGRLQENLIVIAGEAGIGKTRALREAHRDALRTTDVDIVTQPLEGRDGRTLALELAAQFLPDRTEVTLALSNPAHLSTASDRQRAFHTLGVALRARSAQRRMIWIADRCDPASADAVQLIQCLLATAGPAGPLVLAAGRSSHFLGDLLAEDRSTALSLVGLPRPTLVEIAAAITHTTDPAVPEEIARAARGNPETAITLARSGVYSGDVAGRDAADLLTQTFADQTRGLSDSELAVLQTLAALEAPAPVKVLARALEHGISDYPAIRCALRGLLQRGLIYIEPGSTDARYATSGCALRRWTLERLSSDQKHALHRRALFALRLSEEAPLERLATIACRTGDPTLAAEFGKRALGHLITAGYPKPAVELADELIPAIQSDERKYDAVRMLASEARLRLGDNDGAIAIANALATAAETDPALRFSALVLLAWAEVNRDDLPAATRQLDLAGRYQLAGTTSDRRRFHERRATIHAYRLEDDRARQQLALGLRILGPPDMALGDLHHDLGVVLSHQGDQAGARTHHEIALRLRRQIGDGDGESRSRICLANHELRTGNLGAAERCYEDALDRIRGAGAVATQASLMLNLAISHRLRGDLGRALTRAQEALRASEKIDGRAVLIEGYVQLALIHIERGRLGEAWQASRTLRNLSRQAGRGGDRAASAAVAAELALAHGDTHRTLQIARAALSCDALDAAGSILRVAARACLLLGDPAGARRFLGAGARDSGSRQVHAGAQMSRELAELARAEGRLDDAQELAEEAEMRARALGSRRCITQALVTRARISHAQRRLDDAWPRLREATEIASLHGGLDLLAEVWTARGLHALECGQRVQALSCFSRCIERWIDATRHLGGSHRPGGRRRESAFLMRPDRETVLAQVDVLTESVDTHDTPCPER